MTDNAESRCRLLESELSEVKNQLSQLEIEYAEFEKGSKELEEHLESEVSRLEDELEVANKRQKAMKTELQDAKEKQIDTERSLQVTIQSLEQELERERQKTAKLSARTVGLEQENEDLQRLHRELQADFGKSQTTADNALESNAVLQTDLDDLKNLSRETIQRLTDELRELMEENAILQKKLASSFTTTTDSASNDVSQNSPRHEVKSTPSTPVRSGSDSGTPRSTTTSSPMDRRRDLLDTLNTIAGIAKALETKLKPA